MMPALNFEAFQKAVEQIKPVGDEWLLISPTGHLYKGDAQQLILVLAPHHPLMQLPKFGVNDE
jgi:hypothetical protein